MHFKTIIAVSLPLLGAFAAPQVSSGCTSMSTAGYGGLLPSSSSLDYDITTTTLSLTLTITSTYTYTATSTSSSTTSTSTASALTTPTSAYGLISARSASPVHLLPWSAAGFRFWLGGNTASYCPTVVNDTGSCPPGSTTAFLGTCSMDVMVPGGQALYVTQSGEIGYTQAHSASYPQGAHTCPFAYSKPAGSSFGYISLDPLLAFGATGFMACPTSSGYYQVFANLQNATVPQGNVSSCLGFDALASDYSSGLAAWQYT